MKLQLSHPRGEITASPVARRVSRVAAAVALAAVGALGAVPQAHADGGIGNTRGVGGVAYVDLNHLLVICPPSASTCTHTSLGVAPGTSPAMTALVGGYAVVFQGTNGDLWTYQDIMFVNGTGSGTVFGDDKVQMKAGTSPAITAASDGTGGDYDVAYQDLNGNLTTAAGGANGGITGVWHSGDGVMAHTNPSITAQPNGGVEVAFQAAVSGILMAVGSAGDWNSGLGVAAGTSPAITDLGGTFLPGVSPVAGAGYQVAFQAAGSYTLWTAGTNGDWNSGLGMAPGTSPAITDLVGGGVEVAYQANTGDLYTAGNLGSGEVMATSSSTTGLNPVPMQAGTSPSIISTVNTAPHANPGPAGYTIEFQGNQDQQLGQVTAGPGLTAAVQIGGSTMDINSSPSLTPDNSPNVS